jgi:hypothetical protein
MDPTPYSTSPTGQPPAPAAPPPRRRSFSSWLLKWLLILIAIVAFGTALYVFMALRFSYSEGERAGYVQRFSKKGWVCKTWEGEVAQATLPGTLPETFRFTVRDDEVARQITDTMGERVVLTYQQHVGLPSCFGETSFFVTAVRPRQGEPLPAPGTSQPVPAPETPPVGGETAPAPAPAPAPPVPQPPVQ